MPSRGLGVRQADEYERWRTSPERRRESEAAERQREQEANRYLATLPPGAFQSENNPLVGRMMERRISREKDRSAVTVPFEMERQRLRAEQIDAERLALEEVRRVYREKFAAIGQRELAAQKGADR